VSDLAQPSQVLAAALIVGLFFVALIVVEISRMHEAADTTVAMQTFSEERRLEESLDSLLKITEPRTKETIGEIFANCSYYGDVDLNYAGTSVSCRAILEELFDSFYGRENYYVKIPRMKYELSKDVEMVFIVDTSGSMQDDLQKIGQSILYIKSSFTGNIHFYIYTLGLTMPTAQCTEPNVTCAEISQSELDALRQQAGIPEEHCVLQEAYGLGVAWWASKQPKDSNNIRIIIPASDELSCSDEFISSNGLHYGGTAIADLSIDFGINAIKNHKNVRIYPMLCDPIGVNTPTSLPQKHDESAIREDMNRLARIGPGMLLDFSTGYSQLQLDTILEKIIYESTRISETAIELGTRKDNAERYAFERTMLMPNKKPMRFTTWIYKERVPHQMQTVVVKMPPVAVITANPRVIMEPPYTTNLSGLASYDPDGGTIVSYEWDINGTIVSTQPNFTYTFPSEGQYVVKLTVTDDEGQKGSTTITIIVGKKPVFEFIFVPVNWSGSNEEFESTAKAHFQIFVNGAKLQNCQSNYAMRIIPPQPNNCSVPLLNTCFPEEKRFDIFNQIVKCVQNSGYNVNWATMRIAAITKSDICVAGEGNGVVGFTEFGTYPVVGEAPYKETIAHELGHQFYFCEQYSRVAWSLQNSRLLAIGGCKNYYPDGSTHCPEYGSLTTKCPEFNYGKVDCYGRKIPVGSQVGRSLMGPAGIPYPRLFDCFEEKVIRGALNCP